MIAGSVNKILTASAKAAANACTSDAACDFSWTGASGNTDTATASDGHLGEVFNALEVVQALLWPSAKQVQGVVNGNATQSASPSGTSGVKTPQATGAAGRIEGYLGAVLVSAALVMSLSL
jgi:mannan endo-1,6-alpha-mannosidase